MKKSMVLPVCGMLLLLSMTCYAAGWEDTANGWRYLLDNGQYAANCSLSDGTEYMYRMDDKGYLFTGWWETSPGSGVWYYYNRPYGPAHDTNSDAPEGALLKGTMAEGYELAADGHWSSADLAATEADAQTIRILDQIGWDLRSAFNWCSTCIPYVRFTPDPAPGTNYYAERGYAEGSGNCYTMAAIFCKMAKALGYECRQMSGVVPSKAGNLIPHSWCEINMNGETRVFDPDFTYESKRDGFNIYYGQPSTWMYQNYAPMTD